MARSELRFDKETADFVQRAREKAGRSFENVERSVRTLQEDDSGPQLEPEPEPETGPQKKDVGGARPPRAAGIVQPGMCGRTPWFSNSHETPICSVLLEL